MAPDRPERERAGGLERATGDVGHSVTLVVSRVERVSRMAGHVEAAAERCLADLERLTELVIARRDEELAELSAEEGETRGAGPVPAARGESPGRAQARA